jgi:hypothetical protein
MHWGGDPLDGRDAEIGLKSEDMIGDGITAARDGASKVSRKRECRRGGVAT